MISRAKLRLFAKFAWRNIKSRTIEIAQIGWAFFIGGFLVCFAGFVWGSFFCVPFFSRVCIWEL